MQVLNKNYLCPRAPGTKTYLSVDAVVMMWPQDRLQNLEQLPILLVNPVQNRTTRLVDGMQQTIASDS